ncbi:S-adenosyl-L-methionine-dependent methyltransferase [Neolentinus lepideus HHB14362 ss-1]|uniref:S-adenosyl-L-methionine-dependent methyltransferase n=1 Tax=Neolentinus lepideus HHB14362 ss-1 TaxID=1314782 RepID=A0A165T3D3_9AGAM|nr:S-adenosyl-L-methionine-dependent methyltransferase [Neolentinus lepideus HHB14362 ss-1]
MNIGSNVARQATRHALKRRLARFPSRCLHESSQASGYSTVNPDEIALFSRLSQHWWDEHGEFAFLHKMNPIRMQFIREKMLEVAREEQGEEAAVYMGNGANLLNGLDVVDVGCGGGLLSESLARLGGRTLGIDASEANISIASLHGAADPRLSSQNPSSSSGSLTYQHTSAEDLLRNPQRFDVVCSMEVLEHVDNPSGFLSSCAELLKV